MNYSNVWLFACAAVLTAYAVRAGVYGDTPDSRHAWAVHDSNRPRPPVVTAEPGRPPSDATVLFDGSSLDAWVSKDGAPCKWRIVEGAMEVVPKTGEIRTRQAFGDCQLHLEWASPSGVKGDGQGRGNSGVFLMGMHEIQILDSFNNDAYADGQAASVYAETPPLVNACRKPGEWQTYDIIFHQPVWEGETLKHPGSVTVLHNGVLVQDHWEFEGMTTHCRRRPLAPYASRLPLALQDHGDLVRFRNIWIREIPSRYANTTHGGPAANEADVMALRRETADKLFAEANPADQNKRAALGRMLEVVSYDKTEEYMQIVLRLRDEYLQELSGLNAQQIQDRKGDIIALRNECNVLVRNKVFPEECKLRAELQRIIQENALEKKN
ncbi:MAG: DUF1080 domain-containing protein [Kiritimatiellae bacterium]|nr:DUF1080 domain-containing protein [Kiritimatiellia bacterium]